MLRNDRNRRSSESRRQARRVFTARLLQLESLETRRVLNAAPVAVFDPQYSTAVDTALVVSSSGSGVLANDWDPDGGTLSASVVDSPAHGTLSGFSSSSGTFTYTPDTSYEGVDTFTYEVSDGSATSSVVTVSIAVGGALGARTNLEENVLAGDLLAGDLVLAQPLTPGLSLVYNSGTIPQPIIAIETYLQSTADVPDNLTAQLTFDGSAGTEYSYDTMSMSAGGSFRLALQADATSTSTGRYDYSVDITAEYTGGDEIRTFTGSQNVVNRGDSTNPFGRGWQLAGLDSLAIETGGVLWVRSTGESLWFADDGAGGYLPAEGDLTFSTLTYASSVYTLTDSHGIEMNFDSGGLLTSQVDRNGNTVSYSYTSGLLTTITDPFSRDITLAYTSGQLTSVTDFAGRVATLAYDAGGRLTSITQPDPDGAGALSSPVTAFGYNTTTNLLTSVTDALSHATSYGYSNGRLTSVTFPDSNAISQTPIQTVGLPTGTTGNTLAVVNPYGHVTDERSQTSDFRTDRYGNVTTWVDQLDHTTALSLDSHGQVVKLTEADPDGAGALTSPVTVLGYDESGNLVYQLNPRGYTHTWTYTTFNLVASETDELDNEQSWTYDSYGNVATYTDGAGYVWSYDYDAGGRVTEITSPDPDGAAPAGPLDPYVTTLAYDSYGRLSSITYDDSSSVSFGYDSADNRTTVTDELDQDITYTFDALARMTSVTDRGSATTSYDYDALGQLLTVTDALGFETDYEYNSRGWKTAETLPDPDGAGDLERLGSTYTYDAAGNLTQIGQYSYSGGATIVYTYDSAGRRTSQTGPHPYAVTEWCYDNLNRVTKTIDALDQEVWYTYDSAGNVTVAKTITPGTYPQTGPSTTYAYDAANQLVQMTDPRGFVTDYTFDARGLQTRVDFPDPDGSGSMARPYVITSYDGLGRNTGTVDALHRVNLDYDARGRVILQTDTDPDGAGGASRPETAYEYDSAGRLVSITDPLSRVTEYEYDGEGRAVSVTLPDPDGAGSLTSPVYEATYDAVGEVLTTTDPLGNVTTNEYDGMRRLISVTSPDPDGAGGLSAPVTLYVYGDRGLLESIIDPEGRQTDFTYDNYGRKTDVTDELGNVTSYVYDYLDRVTSVTGADPDGVGSLSRPVTTYDYDYLGRIIQIVDPESGETDFTYDNGGNLLTLTDPVDNVTSWSYDNLGRVTIETNELNDARSFYYDIGGRLTRKVDRNDLVTQYQIDGLDRVTAEEWRTSATPVPQLSITVSQNGGPTNEVQRVGVSASMALSSGTFTLTFDGQTTSAIAYNASAATVQAALEALSNIDSGDVTVVKTQATYQTQEWQVTFGGALEGTDVSQITVNSSGVMGYMTVSDIEATDTQGGSGDEIQVVTLSNSSGGTFRLAFGGETTYALDEDATAGEVEAALEELNTVDDVSVSGSAGGPWTVTFGGDQAGEDQPTIAGDAATLTSGTLARTISYAYDAAGQLVSASDPDSEYAYTYDNLGRVLTVDNDGTPGVPQVVLTSAYDAAGNRTSLSATVDSTADFLNTYTYDGLHRLTQVTQEEQSGGNSVVDKRVDFAYNAASQYTSIARYNDVAGGSGAEIATSVFSYDLIGRLSDLAHQQGSTDLFTPYEWTYDGLSRITQIVSADGTSDYSYDETSQLTAADYDFQTDESYSYDANGNRAMTGYSTGDNNQLLSDGTYDYTYDDEGNRLTRTNTSTYESTEYTWDQRNRLIRVEDKDSMSQTVQVVEYIYDVFNRRIGRAVDTTSSFDMADAAIERYVLDDVNGVASLDGGNVVLDFVDPDGDGTDPIELNRRYLFGNAVDQLLAQENVTESTSAAARVHWPLTDHLGTVRDLVENDGTLGEHYTYTAYGQVASGDTSLTRYLFTSRELDEATGLQYNRARWYDAAAGRWMSEDPLGFAAADANLTRYAKNELLGSLDPSGLQPPLGQRIGIDPDGPRPNTLVGPVDISSGGVLIGTVTVKTGVSLTRAKPPMYTPRKIPGYMFQLQFSPAQGVDTSSVSIIQFVKPTAVRDGEPVGDGEWGVGEGESQVILRPNQWTLDVPSSGTSPAYHQKGLAIQTPSELSIFDHPTLAQDLVHQQRFGGVYDSAICDFVDYLIVNGRVVYRVAWKETSDYIRDGYQLVDAGPATAFDTAHSGDSWVVGKLRDGTIKRITNPYHE